MARGGERRAGERSGIGMWRGKGRGRLKQEGGRISGKGE